MTYSIFDSTGNVVDAFEQRKAGVAALQAIVQTEAVAADDVFLVAQGEMLGNAIYASSGA